MSGAAAVSPTRDRVVAADVTVAAVPLEWPIHLRGEAIREREYVVLRLRTDSGLEGAAIGYTRGLPVAPALDRFAASIVANDAAPVLDRGEQSSSPDVRASSLVEIALWDVAARRAGLPLWRLLGAARPRVPVLAVGGYFPERRTLADVQAELQRLAEQGFRHVKVHAHEPEPVAARRAALPDDVELAVDVGMRFRGLDEALAGCRPLDGLGLGFIEDPFPPECTNLTRALAEELETPVAAGEDTGPAALQELVAAADVVRIDATTSGGIGAVAAVALGAEEAGKRVLTHAFVELHGQVAGGLVPVSLAETIPYDSGANPVDRLLAETQPIERGELVLSERPGHGLLVDWDAVAHYARTTHTHDRDRRSRCA
jgi:L-alanine-DL-glutamate epimerase-like enolase superfamily enzyme